MVTESVTVTRITVLNFSWTEEEVAAILRKQVDEYLASNFPVGEALKAKVDMTYGSVYQGGVEAHARVTMEAEQLT